MSSLFNTYVPFYPSAKELDYTDIENLPPEGLLELARVTLADMRDSDLRCAEIVNAIGQIETALMYLDHRKQRRQAAGIYHAPIPEDDTVLKAIQRIQHSVHFIVEVYVDTPEQLYKVSELDLGDVYLYNEIGIIQNIIMQSNNDFLPWLITDDEETGLFKLGVVVKESSRYPTIEDYNQTKEVFNVIKQLKHPSQLAVHDLTTGRTWVYPTYMTTLKGGIEQAINIQQRLIRYINKTTGKVGFGAGNALPGLYIFHSDMTEEDYNIFIERLSSFMDDIVKPLVA